MTDATKRNLILILPLIPPPVHALPTMKYVTCLFAFAFSPLRPPAPHPPQPPKAPRPARPIPSTALSAPQKFLTSPHHVLTNHMRSSTTALASAACMASYLSAASSSSLPPIVPSIQITRALNTTSSPSFFANATTSLSNPWTLVAALLNTNVITLLLLPLVIREIPTFMTTTLDPLLDYVLDPWSWSYFPVWCAEVWRLLREESEGRSWVGVAATAATTTGVAVGRSSVERVWKERGVVEEVTLRVGGKGC
ncbi:hypothetical protein B0J12DRAFT_702634 [Macrophomina phaseolina]|uniref:Uncharacterized protein n=1 Tax=Macrophomina phaseolina TaxID=35725 RepID=A0ABQ8G139_9PEZI|nr:hypothetical protein B0J12DRAFT_702634 [Macrophomina phaseolina]